MKVIILAAGKGTRLNKYTQDMPKGMLKVFDKPLIMHQVETYKRLGVNDVTVIAGYQNEKINIPEVNIVINHDYGSTNMVESLFCAADKIDGDVIISYGDIIFEERICRDIIDFSGDIGVAVDIDWKDYWIARYGRVDYDIESLSIKGEQILELGFDNPNIDNIDGRYVGMIRLNAKGAEIFKHNYFSNKKMYYRKIWKNKRTFENIFMTDFLMYLIEKGIAINPIIVKRGWLEFDTNEDYELVEKLYNNKSLEKIYKSEWKAV